MKVVFIRPNPNSLITRVGRRHNRAWPPLDLLNCAAIVKVTKAEVEIIDLHVNNISHAKLVQKIDNANLIFVTTSAIDRWQCPCIDITNYIDFIRNLPNKKVIIMGAHGTINPGDLLYKTKAHAVIRGEPENTVAELVKNNPLNQIAGLSYLIKGCIKNNLDRPPLDMQSLPLPAYELINLKYYSYELLGPRMALLETTRGCNFSCAFCFKKMYGQGVRIKTLKQTEEEMNFVINTQGASSIYFFDLEFTLQRDRVLHICDIMKHFHPRIKWCCQTRTDLVDESLLKTMAKSGCCLIHYGVESGNKRILNLINKKIDLNTIRYAIEATHAAGIKTACFFLLGFPTETFTEIKQTLNYAKSLNPTYASFHIATPYPETPLSKFALGKEGFARYYKTAMEPRILEMFTRNAFLSYYIRPKYLFNQLLRGIPHLWIEQIKLMLGYIK